MRRNAKKGENFFKRNAQKPLTKDEKEDIMKTLRENSALCRRRLAVWRQLPKLFPASSTLVACSKKTNAPKVVRFSFWKYTEPRRESRVEKIAGAICLPENLHLRKCLMANQTICNRLSGRAAKSATLVACSKNRQVAKSGLSILLIVLHFVF